MNPRTKAIKELSDANYIFARHGANHDIYVNKELGVMIPLKRHDFDENDLRYIQKEIRSGKRRG